MEPKPAYRRRATDEVGETVAVEVADQDVAGSG
jgi:hypothetical protein